MKKFLVLDPRSNRIHLRHQLSYLSSYNTTQYWHFSPNTGHQGSGGALSMRCLAPFLRMAVWGTRPGKPGRVNRKLCCFVDIGRKEPQKVAALCHSGMRLKNHGTSFKKDVPGSLWCGLFFTPGPFHVHQAWNLEGVSEEQNLGASEPVVLAWSSSFRWGWNDGPLVFRCSRTSLCP